MMFVLLSGVDERSSRMMLSFRDQLPMGRLMADLEIPSELGQGRHRSRSALAYWHASSPEGMPSAGAVFRQVVDNWRSWGFVVPPDVEQELRAIGVWSEEPTPLFLHEMIPFRKVSRAKGNLTFDQELIGTAHGVNGHKLQTAATLMGGAIRRGQRILRVQCNPIGLDGVPDSPCLMSRYPPRLSHYMLDWSKGVPFGVVSCIGRHPER
jgi:hypothetical protein